MVALRIGRDLVGAAPFIVCGGRLSLLSPGWDLEYAQYSPCHLLFVEAMRQGGANAALEADFLTADAPYKMQYTRQCRPRVDVVVAATRRKLTQLILAELGTSALQRLKRAFGPSRSR
jgi:CelD/BcsL family acetyltransferase involved in cellulose biosynthesis